MADLGGVNRDDVTTLNNKLTGFAATLTSGEQKMFGALMLAAHDGITGDTAGYDDNGPAADLATKINWDGLTSLGNTTGVNFGATAGNIGPGDGPNR